MANLISLSILIGSFKHELVEILHSHEKRKDSLEGSLDRVLLAAEHEFSKILVPRLLQHTSNVNNVPEGQNGKKRQCSLYVTSFLEH